jgi:hypothetical protein
MFGYGNRLDRCGEQGYILVSCAHSNTSFRSNPKDQGVIVELISDCSLFQV